MIRSQQELSALQYQFWIINKCLLAWSFHKWYLYLLQVFILPIFYTWTLKASDTPEWNDESTVSPRYIIYNYNWKYFFESAQFIKMDYPISCSILWSLYLPFIGSGGAGGGVIILNWACTYIYSISTYYMYRYHS